MNMILSPVRRVGATLVIAGIAAFGSVAVAPAALAEEPAVVQAGEIVPAAPIDPAPVVVEQPGSTGQPCTAADLEQFAKDQAKWTKQAAVLTSLAKKSKASADLIRAQMKFMKAAQKKHAEMLVKALDKLTEALESEAAALLDKAKFGLQCTVEGAPRF
jgi:hypothetical protein